MDFKNSKKYPVSKNTCHLAIQYCQNSLILAFLRRLKTSINVFVNHEEPIETQPYFIFIFILSLSSFPEKDFVSLLVLLI